MLTALTQLRVWLTNLIIITLVYAPAMAFLPMGEKEVVGSPWSVAEFQTAKPET